MTIEQILEHGKAQDKMLQRLKSMRVQSIIKEPEWKNCIYCSLSDDTEINSSDRDVMFNSLAGALVSRNKIPLEIAKLKSTYFVRTEKNA